jgi:hypothetical protein
MTGWGKYAPKSCRSMRHIRDREARNRESDTVNRVNFLIRSPRDAGGRSLGLRIKKTAACAGPAQGGGFAAHFPSHLLRPESEPSQVPFGSAAALSLTLRAALAAGHGAVRAAREPAAGQGDRPQRFAGRAADASGQPRTVPATRRRRWNIGRFVRSGLGPAAANPPRSPLRPRSVGSSGRPPLSRRPGSNRPVPAANRPARRTPPPLQGKGLPFRGPYSEF